ncbi:biliverdin-producing heme oxygenase [Hymenobacter sp. DH14]|uniref:Biliverdin-producing heme oxygenase n=1 Tax=Hymenobacter cyanobacteriorum TaxID=2926463 RepID=A0A9X1VEQ6_9BACT|nr:biliverdin-producing heme oxygenase [Hymenobacter cyanobacteriorum]MCI1187347.1 biliverdin-producing heme oxygenase [Hymenobacter cyanobacteriorum]
MNSPQPPTATPAESPALLPRLRLETRPYHDSVEANAFNQALTAGRVTAAETAQFLARMYGFVQPYEAALRRHAPAFGPDWQLEQRYRAHFILEDLARLGYPAEPPLCPALPPLETRAQLLGAMYVLEGSTLGGQVIARQLAAAGIDGRTFFASRAERTGPLWKQFGQLLEAAAASEDADAIVASAILTFQTLAAWLIQE